MGALPPPLVAGTACRIFTGAALPDGADAVVMQEDVLREGDWIRFDKLPGRGAHVRQTGEDLKKGDLAIEVGTRLGPFHLALAASLDYAELVVHERPRVTIVCTGDELRAPGDAPDPGTIAECNSIGLRALAEQAGASVRVAPLVRDDPAATQACIEQALQGTDLLVTVGGVSVGDHDVVRPALERAGVTLEFWKVAIKPGKPLALGRTAGTRVLALPGNPASSLVTFSLFGLPLLRAMQGDRKPLPATLRTPLAAGIVRKPGRLEFMRARLETAEGGVAVRVLPNQASGAVTSMAWADALALVEPDVVSLSAGDTVEVLRFADA
jgi:molybdopterin molybdotransferase